MTQSSVVIAVAATERINITDAVNLLFLPKIPQRRPPNDIPPVTKSPFPDNPNTSPARIPDNAPYLSPPYTAHTRTVYEPSITDSENEKIGKLLSASKAIAKNTNIAVVSLPVSLAANFFELSICKNLSKNHAATAAEAASNA